MNIRRAYRHPRQPEYFRHCRYDHSPDSYAKAAKFVRMHGIHKMEVFMCAIGRGYCYSDIMDAKRLTRTSSRIGFYN